MPKGAEGGRLSYDNTKHEPLDHTNSTAHINTILDNRKSTMGGVTTGTCVVNESDPPIWHSVMSSNSSSRSKHLLASKVLRIPQWYMERSLKTPHAAERVQYLV